MRVRRVRYASAAAETIAYRGHDAARAPGARRLAGAGRALARASPGGPRRARGGRRPGPCALVGAGRAGGAARRARWSSPCTGPTPRCSARPGWRAGSRGRCSRARGSSPPSLASSRAGSRPRRAATSPPAHVHPMPVDSSVLALDHAVAAARSSSRGSPPRSGSTSRSRRPPSSRRCGHDLPLTIVGDGPGARARSSVRSSGSASRRSSASPAPCRRPRSTGSSRPAPTSCSFRPRVKASASRRPRR